MTEISFRKMSEHYFRYIAEWSDNTARYHVWVTGDKSEGTIYVDAPFNSDGSPKIPIDAGFFPTRKLDIDAKRNSAIQREIAEAIAKGALIKADEAYKEEQARIKAEEDARLALGRRRQLNHIANITGSRDLHAYLQNTSDADIAALKWNYERN